MHPFLPFLQSQHLLTIAMCAGTEQWIANLYFGTDENGTMYFISPTDTAHSKMILKNRRWFFQPHGLILPITKIGRQLKDAAHVVLRKTKKKW